MTTAKQRRRAERRVRRRAAEVEVYVLEVILRLRACPRPLYGWRMDAGLIGDDHVERVLAAFGEQLSGVRGG